MLNGILALAFTLMLESVEPDDHVVVILDEKCSKKSVKIGHFQLRYPRSELCGLIQSPDCQYKGLYSGTATKCI